MFLHLNPSQALHVLNQLPSNRVLTPREGTPLAQIVRRTIEAMGLTTVAATEEEIVDGALISTAIDTTKQNEAHEAAITEVVNLGARQVEAQLRYVRNDVISIIDEIHGKVSTAIEDVASNTLPYAVASWSLSPVVELPIVKEVLGRYNTGATVVKPRPDVFKALTGADLESVVAQEATASTEVVKGFFDGLPVNCTDIYNKVLLGIEAENYPTQGVVIAPTNTTWSYLEALAIIILAEGLMVNTPANVNAAPAEMKLILQNLQKTAVVRVKQELSAFENEERVERLVTRSIVRNGVTEIICHSGLLERYKANGGGETSIIGAFLNDTKGDLFRFTSEPQYMQRAKAAYDSYMKRMRMVINDKRTSIVTNQVMLAVEREINSFEGFADLGHSKEAAIKLLREVVQKNPYNVNGDVYSFVRKVVCRTIFPSVSAEFILESIDKYCKENEGMEPREAALLVERDLLNLWVFSQMELSE